MAKEKEIEDKTTPMLKQYNEVKEQYPDHIIFFRLGDFYEMFGSDAELCSKVLGLVLTSRAGVPMCGVPYHSTEMYIKKLIENHYRVAICEQLTDPHASKGLVQRGVVRLLSAGTVIEASLLNEDTNNYITAVLADKEGVGLAFADISTGEVQVFEKRGKTAEQEVCAEMTRFHPVELLVNQDFLDLKEVCAFVNRELRKSTCDVLDDDKFDSSDISVVTEQFESIDDFNAMNIDSMPLAKKALCGLFRYVGDTYKSKVRRFSSIKAPDGNEYMDIGFNAMRNLELCETMRSKEKQGSLLGVLDKTVTAMGRRLLRSWVERPLMSHTAIIDRLDSVEELINNGAVLCDLRETLKAVYDLERLMSRIMYKNASPRDICQLGKTCAVLPAIKDIMSTLKSRKLQALAGKISELSDVTNLAENAIVENPPATLREGNVIRKGFNKELDRLREIAGGGENVLREIEKREREATGIRTLKVGSNRVYGYYIEVSKSFADKVPDYYQRRQTLTNGERYITEELKKVEGEILSANDRIVAIEQAVFDEVREFMSKKLSEIQTTAAALSEIDALCSMAQVSLENGYVKPEITLDNVIDIRDGRHPVVEALSGDSRFTPNDVHLDCADSRMLIITGPNMAGKSTFMRQTALIVLMAQIGCFVPASYARIGVVDKIFTRVGASDDLTAGQSTFMVEMNEVAEILKCATKRSLVILDEIGRGTSTFDGISIAKATVEHICNKIGCKTLFATHYHELITMEKETEGIKNFSVAVTKRGDDIKFLHKIIPGGTDDSYGIQVAKLAGIPNKVIDRAKEVLKDLEVSGKIRLAEALEKNKTDQMSFAAVEEQNAIARIRSVDLNSMSPMDALMFVKELKDSLSESGC